MAWLVQPLLFFLARCSRNQLIRNIEFLKAENEILRKRYVRHHVVVSQEDRARLIKLGEQIGPDLKRLITIVRYDTYLRWVRQTKGRVPSKKRGRPRKPDEIRQLVLKIARETGWGYTRVLGELRKLGIHDVSRQTVVNILKENGYDPDSKRGPGSWDELLKMHAETLWQCDFFSKRVLSRFGMPQVFAMVFLNLATRRVWVSPATRHPTEEWVEQQAKAFIEYAKTEELKVDLVTRDNDKIYNRSFDRVMKEAGARPRYGWRSARPTRTPTWSVSSNQFRSSAWITFWSSARSISTTWFKSTSPIITRSGRTRGWGIGSSVASRRRIHLRMERSSAVRGSAGC